MGALFTVPGPVFHYVRFRGSGSFFYLGTAQVSPEVETDPSYLPVMNDRKSRTKPMQKVYDGDSHAIMTVLNHLDLAVWRRTVDAQGHFNTVTNQGIDGSLELGSLVFGLGDFELLLLHAFFGTSNATPDLRAGRLYLNAVVGKAHETSGGTRVFTATVRFDCESAMHPVSGQFPLFTEDLTGITVPPPTS